MGRFGLCSGFYTSESVNADAQECINWYPDVMETQDSKSAVALYPMPGTKIFETLPDSPVWASLPQNGRAFALAGVNFYEVFANGTYKKYGPIVNDGQPKRIVGGQNFLMFASGGVAYYFDLTADTLNVANTGQGPVSMVDYSDGYFIALIANSNKFQVSNLGDPTTWNGLQVAQISEFPDNLLCIKINRRYLWAFGVTRTIVYQNTGAFFPYQPLPGIFMNDGIAAPWSATNIGDALGWIAQNEAGQGIAYIANGFARQRVSTHAVEGAWAKYPTIADAIGYPYQDGGHNWWRIYFPTANVTWQYDITTGLWSKPAYWNGTGNYIAHLSRCHMFVFGKHLLGDWNSGNLYWSSFPVMNGSTWNFCDDFGNPIRRLRRAPHISTEDKWMYHSALQIDLEAGVGPQPPLLDGNGYPRDPVITLRWSDDGGHNYSNSYDVGIGQAGVYDARARWLMLGRSRDRIYEVSCSDPVPVRIIDAYLEATNYTPQERMAHQYRKGA